jgi:hypothetical protein
MHDTRPSIALFSQHRPRYEDHRRQAYRQVEAKYGIIDPDGADKRD